MFAGILKPNPRFGALFKNFGMLYFTVLEMLMPEKC